MRQGFFLFSVLIFLLLPFSGCLLDPDRAEVKTVLNEFLKALDEEDKTAAVQRAPAFESLTNDQWSALFEVRKNNPDTRDISIKIKKITRGEEYLAVIGDFSWIIRKLPSNNWIIDPAPSQTLKIDYIPARKE